METYTSLCPFLERQQSFSVAVGHVEKLYSERMDRGMYRFPCFTLALDTEMPHGFSGGPIINERGAVCGVVSGGRVGSLIYPALVTQVSLDTGSKLLLDLVREGHIPSDGSESVVNFIPPSDDSPRWSCSYNHESHNDGHVFRDLEDEQKFDDHAAAGLLKSEPSSDEDST